jgi:hypothetical protein
MTGVCASVQQREKTLQAPSHRNFGNCCVCHHVVVASASDGFTWRRTLERRHGGAAQADDEEIRRHRITTASAAGHCVCRSTSAQLLPTHPLGLCQTNQNTTATISTGTRTPAAALATSPLSSHTFTTWLRPGQLWVAHSWQSRECRVRHAAHRVSLVCLIGLASEVESASLGQPDVAWSWHRRNDDHG